MPIASTTDKSRGPLRPIPLRVEADRACCMDSNECCAECEHLTARLQLSALRYVTTDSEFTAFNRRESFEERDVAAYRVLIDNVSAARSDYESAHRAFVEHNVTHHMQTGTEQESGRDQS